MYYENAKKAFHEMIRDGWNEDEAKNETICSYCSLLTKREQSLIWKLKLKKNKE
jgi:hypothetical protein